MNSPDLELNLSPLEKLLDYHRLLRIIEKEFHGVLDEHSTARLIELITRRIQQLELPAAVQIDQAREARGVSEGKSLRKEK